MRKVLIVENEFIEDLFLTQNDNELRKDLYEFLNTDYSGYHLICNFKNQIEYENALNENPIWEIILDKFETIEYKKALKIELECKSQKNIHSLFLLNISKENSESLTSKFGHLIISNSNLEEKWAPFYSLRKGVQYKITKSEMIPDSIKMDNWSKMNQFYNPINSVIIFDKYVLNDSSNQKMVKNLFPLLELILVDKKNILPVNITIITEPKEFGYCIKDRHKSIIKYLKTKGITNFNLNIIKHYKEFYPMDFEGLHSRFILTNYFHFKSDDSFNYFKNNGKVNNDADIRISFNLNKNNDCFYKKELNDLRKYLSKINNNADAPKEKHKLMFYPNKENLLIL
ncbi:hypothetical protein [Cellulophaga baltica]|uniref:hypothetical protein n=1 Tax=Cellulophaga baltica TaxID=76594 RepID=UPI0003FC498A|nr:hypothetical protein [Cellulophaga baltica]